MPSLRTILAANSARTTKTPYSPTAVFVGATSGIGLGGIEAFLVHTTSPTVFIIGRSRAKFQATLDELQTFNPKAKLTFLEGQVSSLKEVERICGSIKQETEVVDVLWLSQGGLMPPTHSLSEEGLTEGFAINYYSRILFIHILLPLLNKSENGRILSILSPGNEGALNLSDPGLRNATNYGLLAANKQGVTMMSLALHHLSIQNPTITFMHSFPGAVHTSAHARFTTTMQWPWKILGYILTGIMVPISWLFGLTPRQAGEVGVFECTDVRFSAGREKNFFRLWEDAEVLKASKVLDQYVEEGMGEKVWEHTVGVFEEVLGR